MASAEAKQKVIEIIREIVQVVAVLPDMERTTGYKFSPEYYATMIIEAVEDASWDPSRKPEEPG